MQTIQLTNDDIKITLFDYGARIIDWQVKLGNQWRPIVLRYPNLEDYIDDPFYLGAVCGPYANRIAKGFVRCAERDVQLSCNDGKNHLHGGFAGLDKQYWKLVKKTVCSVTLQYQHDHGADGYAGPSMFEVTYTLIDHRLTLDIYCRSESPTVVGPTGHAYFNLNGVESPHSGLEQYLQSDAAWVTPLNEQGLPDGNEYRANGSDVNFEHPILLSSEKRFTKLDNNFVYAPDKNQSVIADSKKQLFLSVTSNYPAVQLYSGGFLDKPFSANQGVCIEPHFGADAPNRTNVYDWLLLPNQMWHKTINYQLMNSNIF